MTERGFTPAAAGSATAREPDPPNWVTPNARPFAIPPLTAPDHVPTALLSSPVYPPADPYPRVGREHTPARRLAELAAGEPPTFDLPTAEGSPAALLAAHCPDLFLVSAPPDRRPELIAEVVAHAATSGRRVLVLAARPWEVLPALARNVVVGRAVAPGEEVSGRACAAFTAHARGLAYREQLRVGLSDRVTDLQSRIATEERREQLQAEADARSVELARIGEVVAAAVERSEAFARLQAERAAGVEAIARHAARRAEAEQELSALRQAAAQPVGFLKKLFGGANKPEAGKLEAAEARLREANATTLPDPEATFAAAVERLHAEERAKLRTELEGQIAAAQSALALLPPAEPLDELCRVFNDTTADLARLDAGPPVLPTAEIDAIRVVIGPPAAVGHDLFLTPTHPEVEPLFDRIIWADAEDLTEEAFTDVARLGNAWVLIGTPDPLHAPGFRNGRPRAAFFSDWWQRLHSAPWTQEDGRPLARLLRVESRDELQCEPLHNCPDIEVRWADREGTPTLAEVLFPAGMPMENAKSFLATEAGEVRVGGFGAYEWGTNAGGIICRWPAVEAATATRADVDLGHGITERTVGGITAAVLFDANTWTDETAAQWLSERLLPAMRTASL
ncbi:MAG: hypothetical protein MUF18_06050 [Fimbriiglobus sp.]|nr:hypothetical protein [Fimbriiglobus sp.]